MNDTISSPITRHPESEALQTILASAALAEVLRLFLVDPSRAYYQRQIETLTGLPIRTVQRELDRLSAIGLLYRRAEGNRAYYRVDTGHAFYSDLRSLVLKIVPPLDRLRAILSSQAAVRLAFLGADGARMLVVLQPGGKLSLPDSIAGCVDSMTSEEFVDALKRRLDPVMSYLKFGEDLLGHRDDVIWRQIESAGISVKRAQGVA